VRKSVRDILLFRESRMLGALNVPNIMDGVRQPKPRTAEAYDDYPTPLHELRTRPFGVR
jgi:hypothetical protein